MVATPPSEAKKPINIRLGAEAKAALEQEAHLSGLSLSQLVRQKLGDNEPDIPSSQHDPVVDMKNRLESDLKSAESYLSMISTISGHDIIANIGAPSLLLSKLQIDPSVFSLGDIKGDDLSQGERDRNQIIAKLWDILRGEVRGKVRALVACRMMLELIETIARQNNVTAGRLHEFLRQAPYKHADFF